MNFKVYDIVTHNTTGILGTVVDIREQEKGFVYVMWDDGTDTKENVQSLTKTNHVFNNIVDNYAHTKYYESIQNKRPLLGGSGALEHLSGYQAVISNDYKLVISETKSNKKYVTDYIEPGDILVQFKDFRQNYYPNPQIYHSKESFEKDFHPLRKAQKSLKKYSSLTSKDQEYIKNIIKQYKEEKERVRKTPRARMRKIYI